MSPKKGMPLKSTFDASDTTYDAISLSTETYSGNNLWSDPSVVYEGGSTSVLDITYDFANPQLSFDGYIIESNIGINVLYEDPDTSYYIMAPQLTKWRSRYRGQRSSYRANLEMQQLLYDLRKLYEISSLTTAFIATNSTNLEYGINLTQYFWTDYYPSEAYDASSYDQNEYDGPAFQTVPVEEQVALDLPGTNDIVMRLNRLLRRVETLEKITS